MYFVNNLKITFADNCNSYEPCMFSDHSTRIAVKT